MHQIFEGLDILDAISTVKNLGYLIEWKLEHGFYPVSISVLSHAEFDLEALAVDSRDNTVAKDSLLFFDLATLHDRPFWTWHSCLFLRSSGTSWWIFNIFFATSLFLRWPAFCLRLGFWWLELWWYLFNNILSQTEKCCGSSIFKRTCAICSSIYIVYTCLGNLTSLNDVTFPSMFDREFPIKEFL